jgi:hypothetical protein
VLEFIHLPAMGVAEIAGSTHLKGCTHTFVYLVYIVLNCILTDIGAMSSVNCLLAEHEHAKHTHQIAFTLLQK